MDGKVRAYLDKAKQHPLPMVFYIIGVITIVLRLVWSIYTTQMANEQFGSEIMNLNIIGTWAGTLSPGLAFIAYGKIIEILYDIKSK